MISSNLSFQITTTTTITQNETHISISRLLQRGAVDCKEGRAEGEGWSPLARAAGGCGLRG